MTRKGDLVYITQKRVSYRDTGVSKKSQKPWSKKSKKKVLKLLFYGQNIKIYSISFFISDQSINR